MTSPPSMVATLVACLTPPGVGAIATLGLRGPHAWSIVRGLFRIGGHAGQKLPAEPTAPKHWLGHLGEEPAGACADEVVLVVRRAGPAPWLELHSHGGREVVRYLLELLGGQGAEVCSWQDFERATATDPGQAAALAALVEAPTVGTAAILLDQYHGALAREVTAISAGLAGNDVVAAQTRLADLARRAALGRHLIAPWRVVVAGAPNVGKSSLVNALAGYQRSVVAATPGTTRDVVTTLIAVAGWPVELADTAGMHGAAKDLERAGIDRARVATARADLVLWVIDASEGPVFPPANDKTFRVVINKIDLPTVPGFAVPGGAPRVSAISGDGIGDLCHALARWLVPDPPLPGAAVPFTPFLCDRIEEAHRICVDGHFAEAAGILSDC